MIYLDNAATTLHKPPQVEQAILEALHTAGNPGRGAHEPTLHAARIVLDTRLALAELFHAPDPSCIVFAANATMALNTVLNGVLHPGDHVITTVCEHNSVLRPLYRLRAHGVEVSFTGVDAAAQLCYDQWETLLHPTTRALVVTGASNVTGNGTDLARAADFAHRHGLLFIVDAAQTAGAQPIDVQWLGIDALCFTGHKALLGPQGTGGAYVRPGLQIVPLLVGGSGVHSFDETHPLQMPTALEAGTLNVHGLAGLCAGVRWLLEQGIESLADRENALARLFYEQVRTAPGVTVYGDMTMQPRAPIVALNIGQEDSARVADILWEDYGICVRAGAHCAPLMHKALGTAEQAWYGSAFPTSIPNRRCSRQRRQFVHLRGSFYANKTKLYRAFLPHYLRSYGVGKAMQCPAGARAADPAAAGDLGRVRACMAYAAGGLAKLAGRTGSDTV